MPRQSRGEPERWIIEREPEPLELPLVTPSPSPRPMPKAPDDGLSIEVPSGVVVIDLC